VDVLLVGFGGALGALARFFLGRLLAHVGGHHRGLPLATFAINLTGAAALGALHGLGVAGDARLLLADGFLGAYTTWSTLLNEGIGRKWRAIYLVGTLALGVGAYLGVRLACGGAAPY
jgi:fluoride exporter